MSTSFLKYLSLFALLIQNCLVIVLMRLAKQRAMEVNFLTSAAVLMAEVLKLALCGSIMVCALPKEIRDSGSLGAMLRNLVADYGASTLKCSVPALCYTAQNNLIYYALSKLEIVVFQLIYQGKLLLTAGLSVCILHKALAWQQWASLLLLFAGVVVVQLAGSKSGAGAHVDLNTTARANGVVAALTGSTLSAFAGVYFEWLLKEDMQVSLWARNVQLCLFTVPISLGTVYFGDRAAVRQHGVLGGFDGLVWAVVLTQAFGGLIVAMCMKYADNIMKNFASSGAIILGGAASVFFFKFEINAQFAAGAGMVLASMLVYDPTSLCDCQAAESAPPGSPASPAALRHYADDDGDELEGYVRPRRLGGALLEDEAEGTCTI
jgi:UDP-sugar transporter A1/2/3